MSAAARTPVPFAEHREESTAPGIHPVALLSPEPSLGVPLTPSTAGTTLLTNPHGLERRKAVRQATQVDVVGPNVDCGGREALAAMTIDEILERLGLPPRMANQSALQRAREDFDHVDTTDALDRAALALRAQRMDRAALALRACRFAKQQ